MDVKIKARWLEALRSGEYEQGRAYLKRVNKESGKATYCCIGVLSELVCEEVGLTQVEYTADRIDPNEPDVAILFTRGNSKTSSIIPAVVEKHCLMGDFRNIRRLYDMNDCGTPFPEIADWIEKNF